MGQYDEVVERQRLLLDAEVWADGVKSVHVHSMTSMWYETEESKADIENGMVTDTEFNGGLIERRKNGNVIRTFGSRRTGDELIDSYTRSQ